MGKVNPQASGADLWSAHSIVISAAFSPHPGNQQHTLRTASSVSSLAERMASWSVRYCLAMSHRVSALCHAAQDQRRLGLRRRVLKLHRRYRPATALAGLKGHRYRQTAGTAR